VPGGGGRRLTPQAPVGAIDFGGTKTSLAVVDAGGGVLRQVVLPTPPRPSPAEVAALFRAAWTDLTAGLPGHLLPRTAGLAAPGPADAAAGVLRRAFDWGWRDVPLAALAAGATGVSVRLENDVNCCALAEMRFGAAAGHPDFAWVQFSTGVGGAVVAGGRLLRGASGLAGEIGHVVLDEGGPPCPCGRRGCVEALCSGPAVARRHAQVGGRGDAAAAFRGAAAGDPRAAALVAAVCRDVGRALAIVGNLLDPGLIVLGGGVTASLRHHLPAIGAEMRSRLLAAPLRSLELRPTALGADAALLGAAALALDAPEPQER
jgi:glucokinase